MDFSQAGLPVSASCSFWKGCVLGLHDFAFVSGFVSLHQVHSGSAACPHWSPTTLSIFCPHDFWFVFHLSPLVCLPVQTGLVRTISHLSPTCLKIHSRFSERFAPHDYWFSARLLVAPICFPVRSGCSERFGPHFAFSPIVSHYTCLPLVQSSPSRLWVLLPAWFRTCLPQLSPLYTGLSARMMSHWSQTYLPVRSAPLRTILHLSPTCLRFHHHHQPPSTNHLLQPLLAQTPNAMKLEGPTNKLFGVNAAIMCFREEPTDWFMIPTTRLPRKFPKNNVMLIRKNFWPPVSKWLTRLLL